jgi:Protein of unknown function (DUF2806)
VALIPDRLPGERLVAKIWKTIADNGIGGLLSPWQTKRLGKARTEVRRNDILILAQARRDAAEIAAGRKSIDAAGRLIDTKPALALSDHERPVDTADTTTSSLPTETVSLLEHLKAISTRREMDRALNIAMIVAKAEEEAESIGDVPISDKPVDPDWFARWRVNSEDVSNDEMQRLWARILAGETKEPGSFSLHTLDFIRRLSKDDAAQIEKLAPFVSGRHVFHDGPHTGEIDKILEGKGLSLGMLIELQDLGVMSGIEALGFATQFRSIHTHEFFQAIRFQNKALIITAEDPTKILEMFVYGITKVGSQVISLGRFAPNMDYVLQVGRAIITRGFHVKLGDVEIYDAERFSIKNAQAIT